MDGNIEIGKKQSLMHAIYERYKEVNDCLTTADSTSMFLMIGNGGGSAAKNHETPNSSNSSSPISDDANSPSSPLDIGSGSVTTDSCISFYIPTAYSPRKSRKSSI